MPNTATPLRCARLPAVGRPLARQHRPSHAGSEAGNGINFAQQGDVILATWFVFDAERNPRWLVAELHKTAGRVYSGTLARVTADPAEPIGCWDYDFDIDCVATNPNHTMPLHVVETPVGTLTATFADEQHGSIAYTLDGASGTKPIVPQDFPARPTCAYSASPDLTRATNYTDLWSTRARSGKRLSARPWCGSATAATPYSATNWRTGGLRAHHPPALRATRGDAVPGTSGDDGDARPLREARQRVLRSIRRRAR